MDLIGEKSKFVKEYIQKMLKSDECQFSSKASIARALGIKPQYLNSILSGSRNVSDRFFKKFTQTFNINQNDLDVINYHEKISLSQRLEENSISKKSDTNPCELCAEKERVIQLLNARIEELKETILILKEDRTGKRNSA